MYISYDEILDNCGRRFEADFERIDEYINKFEWGKFILPRHKKLIESYIKSNNDIDVMSKSIGITRSDIRAIFLRIESQFEIYKNNNDVIFIEYLINENVEPIKTKKMVNRSMIATKSHVDNLNKSLPLIEDITLTKKEKIIKKINPRSKNTEKDKIIKKALLSILELNDYTKVFTPTMLCYIDDLFEGLSIDEISNKRKRNKQYILYTLVGKTRPRVQCEKGLTLILEEYKLQGGH
jgi:hypothetical protein